MNDVPKDQDAADLLDDYVSRLQSGEALQRDELLEAHPELASALDCLDALEDLALPSVPEGLSPEDWPTEAQPSVGPLPREFGQYELLEEIGRGGMGVVYKARQIALDRTVAIKMILASHLASPEHVRRFHVEAKAAARLRHSNIVHIHDVGQLNGQDYFAMEYIHGESLAQRLAREKIDVDRAVRLIGVVARAVDHLHQQGIVHRDLKPLNILLDEEGEPYVTDFGLAKVFAPDSEMTATGVIAGSPSYMAPEQAAGHNSEVGHAADVYSLGAILYEMLTGRPPFRESSALDTLLEVLRREPSPPRRLNPHVPRELELICLKCLAKSPHDRYASARALADDLERFARGEALQVRPPNLGQRLWSWTRQQPALASRLGALGLFYVVELVNYYLLREATGLDADFHWKISVLMAVWAIGSVICQQFLDSSRWAFPARYAWGTFDSTLLLAVLLFVADGAASPLIIGYPLLIVGSGLWFRVRFVWLITGLSLVSYGILVVDFYCWRWDEIARNFDTSPDRHIVFAAGLSVLGLVVAYLVHRLRTLSSFYGRREPQ